MTFFGKQLLQVREFHTMNKILNKSFLKIFKNDVPVYANAPDPCCGSFQSIPLAPTATMGTHRYRQQPR